MCVCVCVCVTFYSVDQKSCTSSNHQIDATVQDKINFIEIFIQFLRIKIRLHSLCMAYWLNIDINVHGDSQLADPFKLLYTHTHV